MTTTMMLEVAVLAEAVILAAVLALVLHLRAQMARRKHAYPDDGAAIAAQMESLVQEARLLSTAIADGLEEQASLSQSLAAQVSAAEQLSAKISAQAEEAVGGVPAPAKRASGTSSTRKSTAKGAPATPEVDTAAVAPTRTRKTTAGTRARVSQDASLSPEVEAATDIAAAREKGMDPLGVALQRSLAERRLA